MFGSNFNPISSVRNLVSNPRDWANNVVDNVGGWGYAAAGPIGWTLGSLGKLMDPDVPDPNYAGLQVAPQTRELGSSLTLTPDNPVVANMQNRTRGFLRNSGLNPAAQAAAAANTGRQGFLRMSPIATQFWDRLFGLSKNLENTREGIDTTSSDAAFAQGFFGGGGGGGLGGLGGLFGGGGGGTANPFMSANNPLGLTPGQGL